MPWPAAQPKPPEPSTPATPDDGLVEVAGQLVDPEAVAAVTPVDPDAVESTDPAPPGTEQGGFGVPGTAWTLMGVGLLIGLGMFAELRGLLPAALSHSGRAGPSLTTSGLPVSRR